MWARLVLVLAAWGAPALANVEDMVIDDPRAYAWFIGDQFTRTIRLKIENGWRLDVSALPEPDRLNHWLELVAREIEVHEPYTEVRLTYRLTNTVKDGQAEQRVLPSWELTTIRPDRSVPINVPEWTFTQLAVVPPADAQFLTDADVRADVPPFPAPWSDHLVRVTLVGLAVLVLGLYLFYCHFGAVWLARWRQPFTAALRDLRTLAGQSTAAGESTGGTSEAGLRRFHAAMNEAAGHVVMRDDLDAFFHAQPLYARERGAITEVFECSHRFFFAADAAPAQAMTAQELVDVCRRLSVLELSAP